MTGGCFPQFVTCRGEFLLSGGQVYLNYTTSDFSGGSLGGIPANEQVTGFVDNGDGTFSPVPEPSKLALVRGRSFCWDATIPTAVTNKPGY